MGAVADPYLSENVCKVRAFQEFCLRSSSLPGASHRAFSRVRSSFDRHGFAAVLSGSVTISTPGPMSSVKERRGFSSDPTRRRAGEVPAGSESGGRRAWCVVSTADDGGCS